MTAVHNSTRFHANHLQTVGIILFTDKQTNNQTHRGEYITSRVQVTKVLAIYRKIATDREAAGVMWIGFLPTCDWTVSAR